MLQKGNKERKQASGTSLVFGGWLGASLGGYVLLIVLLILADVFFIMHEVQDDAGKAQIMNVVTSEHFMSSIKLSFVSCTVSAILSMFVAVPIGYTLSRYAFRGRALIDAILDIPVVLPPLVIGLSLLILFNKFPAEGDFWGLKSLEAVFNSMGIQVTNTKLAVVVAQFTVAAAFASRMMKSTFDQIDTRTENVAMTLGASRGQAFFDIILPQAYRGMLAAGTLAWARSLGEFGPILVFAGLTRGKTEVLSTSIYLEINTGNIQGAVVISLLMIILALMTIFMVRFLSEKGLEK